LSSRLETEDQTKLGSSTNNLWQLDLSNTTNLGTL
jgi:hypothetical protein